MEIKEAVVHIKNIINPELSKIWIDYIDYVAKDKLNTISNEAKKNRNVFGKHLTRDVPSNIHMYNLIRSEVTRLYPFFKIKFPKSFSNNFSQIDLLKYEKGGYYNVHTDDHGTAPRSVSVILTLNDNYTGGDVVFTDQKEKEMHRCKNVKNSIIFFPSNFLYPHKIEPVLKGTRYSIVLWLR